VRAAFFVLLFANLVFLAWAEWVDSPQLAKTSDPTARLPRLKLVSEEAQPPQSNPSSGAIHKMAMTQPAVGSAPAGEVTRCVSIGPFNDINVAAKAAGALQTRGLAPQQRGAAGDTRDGYWVYIADVADAASADKIFKSLDRGGFKDARLMPDSEQGRRISVGLFSDRERADRRAKAIERLGFKASVGEHTQPGTVYWLDLILKANEGSVPLADLLSVDTAGSPVSVQSCPAHAIGDPAPGRESAPAPPVPSEARVPATTVAGTPKIP
jgi:hypothetical protein